MGFAPSVSAAAARGELGFLDPPLRDRGPEQRSGGRCYCVRGFVVEHDLDGGSRGVALTILGNDDKAIGTRGGTEDRCAADGEWFDLVAGLANAGIVDASDGRDQF